MPRLLGKNLSSMIVQCALAVTAASVASADLACKSNPCMYGICVDEASSSYRCYCIDGYTGINCEINWDECWSNPCLNGGSCHDAIASYNCTCAEGFVGVNCEQRYSECMKQPCLNNGTCLELQNWKEEEKAGVSCQCLEGFSGQFCEIDASVCNSSVCKNSGECVEGPGLSFACRCAEGWSGRFCEQDVDECSRQEAAAAAAAAVCQNGALCINLPGSYQCACLFGFTGKHCDKLVLACEEDNPCQNSAVCLLEDGQPVCYCVPDYHGLLCELRYDDCESKYAHCENGGRCVDGVNSFSCSCPAPYAGDSCASQLPDAPTPTPTPTTTPTTIPTTTTTSSEQPTSSLVDELTTVETISSSQSLVESRTEYEEEPPPSPPPPTAMLDSGSSSDSDDSTLLASSTWDASTAITGLGLADSYDETATTEPSTPVAPTRRVVTMLPSTSTSTSKSLSSLDSAFTAAAAAAAAATTLLATSLQPTTVAAADDDDDDDFTSLADFHRSTFGSDIDASSSPSTPPAVPTSSILTVVHHACTSDQCANTTRCTHNASQCDCSYRDNCRTRPPYSSPIANAAFNGQSYVRQKFSIDSGSLSILLRLRTKANGGILMHALFDDERYVLLYMELAQLKFQFSCGLQTMLFGELDSPVNNGYEVDLEVKFKYTVEQEADRCSARLLVNGTVAMSGEQLLQTHESVPQFARLHLGGIPLAFSHQFPQIVLGFVGCMSLLQVNQVERDFIRDSVEAVQIEECRSFLCLSNPCKNFGACEEFDGATRCKCISGYSGELCERSICDEDPCHLGATCLTSPGVNFLCVCPLGAHGLFCEKDTTIVQPSFSLFAPGFSSYMAYGVSSSLKDSMELRMRIIPQNLEQISLIAYMGQSGGGGGGGGAKRESSDHFSVTYVRGYLMLTWDLGSGVRRIFTSSPISAHKAHKAHSLQIGRRGRDSWLFVEGVGNVSGQAAGSNTRLDVSPILYIGGHKAKYFESLPHDLPLHTGFSGCIYDIEMRTDDDDDDDKPFHSLTMASPATGRGIGECHRNECSHHSCKNGAVCLNYGPTYSCICMKNWRGPDCSSPINCTSQSTSSCY